MKPQVESPTHPLLDPRAFAEIIEFARRALGPGLAEGERQRWRLLTAQVLEVLSNISPSASQRRRHLRTAAALPVELVAPVEVRGLVTSSIGGGGLSFALAAPPEIGAVLELSIRLPQRAIEATASVVWRNPAPSGEVGASFTQIDERDRDLLEATVIQRLSQISLGQPVSLAK
jgi:hypothetical protein